MGTLDAALLINLLGFTVGVALYSMLAVMVLRHRPAGSMEKFSTLLITTSVLGLLWNLGELYLFIVRDFSDAGVSPLLTALSYSALGFLPSVVVHSSQDEDSRSPIVMIAAYALSITAAVLHFTSALTAGAAPSPAALQLLTVGSAALALLLFISNFRQPAGKKAMWAAALLIFAASSLHLISHREGSSWIVELVAHQSSLPLALVILFQNYRFAFADLFLKRAISLILLTCVAFALYVFVAAPLLRFHETHDRDDVQAIGLILTLWIATALAYPALHKFAVWLVDTVLLNRADYKELELELAHRIEPLESVDRIADAVCRRLSEVLTADKAVWTETDAEPASVRYAPVRFTSADAAVFIPTAEAPVYRIVLGEFRGGRRLLSDEKAMLDSVALLTARRIDALRVTHERCEQDLREQEFSKLAAEAQLTALRAQINPHFLFNALTTIGYLIRTAPDKAFDTLLDLTRLLRRVLRSTGEFCTLGDEMKLIENYLDIEKARFEERLAVEIQVPPDIENIRIPALVLQPIVENAIKHGISENARGGSVRLTAAIENRGVNTVLKLAVFDSGPGKEPADDENSAGVGLRNVRERLAAHYGDAASLTVRSDFPRGTLAVITLPVAADSLRSKVRI